MSRNFKTLAGYVKAFSGYGKPRLNWQEMYELFPDFEFEPVRSFGKYSNYGEAYENKDLSMVITDRDGNVCYLTYKEYTDVNENLAYVS